MFDDGAPPVGALAGIRVLDLTNDLAAYSTRLLGDLGADVIRIEPPGGSPTRRTEPMVSLPATGDPGSDGAGARAISAFEWFVNAGKRSLVLDLDTEGGNVLFERLVRTADVLVETWSGEEAERMGFLPADLGELNPRLVHVSVTPFGRDRPRLPVDDDDLTIMAAGGLLNLGGYPDTPPIAAYGGQSRNAASLFAAVSALIALHDREVSGRGRWVDVSAQECVAQALEDSVVTYEMTGRVRVRRGSDSAEAGTGMYPCADGLVSMVAGRVGTLKAWRALVAWLAEEGVEGAADLQDPSWSEFTFRQTRPAIEQFTRIFERFTSTRTRLELYQEAQRRGIALSPVNDIAGILSDPQLQARGFWVDVPEPGTGRAVIFPGPPYRLSRTPAIPARPAPALGADTASVLESIGADAALPDALREAGVS